jgi:hypothetical protein
MAIARYNSTNQVDIITTTLPNEHIVEDDLELENNENEMPEDINEELFNLLIELKNTTDPELAEDIQADINNLLNTEAHLLNPSYIDFAYAERHGQDNANFFSMIDDLENIHDNTAMNWIDILTHVLIQDAQENIREGIDFNRIFYLDKILAYYDDAPILNAAVRALTYNVFPFAVLKYCTENYIEPLETLMLPEVISAIKDLRISLNTIMKLRDHFTPEEEISTGDMMVERLLSDENRAYLASENGSVTMFKRIVNAEWPANFSFHRELQDPEYFQLITSRQLRNLQEQFNLPLAEVMAMSKSELRRFVNQQQVAAVMESASSSSSSSEPLANTAVSAVIAPQTAPVTVVTPAAVKRALDALEQTEVTSLPSPKSRRNRE